LRVASGSSGISSRVPGARIARAFLGGFLVLAAASVAACQSSSPEDVLGVAGKPAVETMVESPARETVGGGPFSLVLLVPRSTTAGRDYRDGAVLALGELCDGKATLDMFDTGGDPGKAAEAARQAVADGARLIIGPASADAVDAVSAVLEDKGPPIIALVDNSTPVGEGIFAFRNDEVDSALAAARYAAAAGKKKLLVLQPDGLAEEVSDDLQAGMKAIAGKRVYSTYSTLDDEAAKDADAVVLLYSAAVVPEAARVLTALKQNLGEPALFLTSAWARDVYAVPEADGVMVALPDQEELASLASRFGAKYDRPLSMDVVAAYDAVALGCGLMRRTGAESLTRQMFLAENGFRGAAGTFRFDKTGAVKRSFIVYRNDKGQLKPLSPAASQ
jgi:ABC-type branched-subunit amino acid transport system substrate-binding protein